MTGYFNPGKPAKGPTSPIKPMPAVHRDEIKDMETKAPVPSNGGRMDGGNK